MQQSRLQFEALLLLPVFAPLFPLYPSPLRLSIRTSSMTQAVPCSEGNFNAGSISPIPRFVSVSKLSCCQHLWVPTQNR